MEERKYTFYDRYQKVKYANITAEELEVLNISYNKEHYIQMRKDFNNHTNSDCYYYAMLYVMIVYSFNNQIRFNREGKFNLPVGKRDYNANMQRKLSKFVDRIKNGNYVFTTMDFEKFD